MEMTDSPMGLYQKEKLLIKELAYEAYLKQMEAQERNYYLDNEYFPFDLKELNFDHLINISGKLKTWNVETKEASVNIYISPARTLERLRYIFSIQFPILSL